MEDIALKSSQESSADISMGVDLQPPSPTIVGYAVIDNTQEFLLEDTTFAGLNTSLQDVNATNQTFGAEAIYRYDDEQLIFQILLFLFIMISNTTVILAIALSKRGRSSKMNFFIMHLALADLSVGLFSVLTDIIWKIVEAWYAGNVMCKIVRYLQSVALFASTYVLVALSLDRLDAIARPMSFTGSGLRAKILILGAWFFSFVLSVPMLVINNETVFKNTPQCWITFPETWHWQVYFTCLTIVLFLLPALIIAVCYAIIIRIIWSKSREIGKPKRVSNFRMGNINKNDKHRLQDSKVSSAVSSSSSRGVIPLAKVKTIKMTLVIVIMFILCWSPFFIYDFLDVWGLVPASSSKMYISKFIQTLAPLNSAANPLIYGLFSSRICKNLRRIPAFDYLFGKLCKCCMSSSRTDRSTSVCSTYSTIGGDISVKRTSRAAHIESKIAQRHSRERRQSGPPCVHKSLTENETEILMSSLGNGHQEETHAPHHSNVK